MPSQCRRNSCDDGNRNARGVRRHDGAGPAHRFDALDQRPFDVELFDNRFEDPIDSFETREVGIESTGGDERGCIGREKWIRLEAARAFETLARDVLGEIEQERGNACVGEVCGDLRAHRAGTENGDRSNHGHPPHVTMRRFPARRSIHPARGSKEEDE